MKNLRTGALALFTAATMWGTAHASSLFMGAYPDSVIVFDDQKGTLTGRIKLESGLPRSIRRSSDGKLIYVVTNTNSGIEVIDIAGRKVINSFTLNASPPSHSFGKNLAADRLAVERPAQQQTRYRFNGGVPDPSGKFFYTVGTRIEKKTDRFAFGKPQLLVIDLEKKAVTRTMDIAKEDEAALRGGGGGGGSAFQISPDGKTLYQFGDKVIVIDTVNLKVVERLELERAAMNGLDSGDFGSALDTQTDPNVFVSLFNAVDPDTYLKTFGVGRFNLATREFTFTPIGPAPAAMAGLQISPNNRDAYTVVTTGAFGNKRCEFWHFDLRTTAIKTKREFECKSRYSFSISSNGQKLYIWGASYDLEIYDGQTLRLERTWDLQNDITGAGLVIVN